MHILATFFALLLSFGHASSVRKAFSTPQPSPTVTAVEFTARPAFVPVHHAIIRSAR